MSAKIAVIEDDRSVRQLISIILMEAGYEVAASPELTTAYEFVLGGRPDAVVLDMLMGRQPVGFQVLEQLANDKDTSTIPIIVSSVMAESLKRWQSRCKYLRLLPKPFELEDLLLVVEDALRQSRQRPLMRE